MAGVAPLRKHTARTGDIPPWVSPIDRIPPNNLEAEMALLGAMLCDRDMVARITAIVRADDFYASLHETVFRAITALYDAGDPVDKISLAEELRRRGMLDKSGGLSYLTSLMDTVPTAASAEYYARIVAEKSRLRQMIAVGNDITTLGYDGEDDVDVAIASAFGAMQAFVDATTPLSRRPMSLAEASDDLEAALDAGTGTFHPTPFPALTKNIGGWKKGGLYILGGSPKMGKSFLANTCALHLASLGIGSVPFYPLEIGRRETIMRLEQAFSRVNALKRVRRIPLSEAEVERLADARRALAAYPLRVFDGYPSFSTDDIVLSARRTAADGPIAGVFVDHIGFLTDVLAPEARTTKHGRLEVALNRFRALAQQLECPVFLVWHVNREAKDGPPTIFDLRDGGNVEGIAQTVLFARRPNWNKSDGSQREAELIIGATRMGYHGTISAYFDDDRGVWCARDGHAFFDPAPAAQDDLMTYADQRLDTHDADDDLSHTPFDY